MSTSTSIHLKTTSTIATVDISNNNTTTSATDSYEPDLIYFGPTTIQTSGVPFTMSMYTSQ
eukprot:m.279557 g.279557  ORF g.279557 m.279557 type:complete len:61 (-) comp142043_c0_seq1:13-195(-)